LVLRLGRAPLVARVGGEHGHELVLDGAAKVVSLDRQCLLLELVVEDAILGVDDGEVVALQVEDNGNLRLRLRLQRQNSACQRHQQEHGGQGWGVRAAGRRTESHGRSSSIKIAGPLSMKTPGRWPWNGYSAHRVARMWREVDNKTCATCTARRDFLVGGTLLPVGWAPKDSPFVGLAPRGPYTRPLLTASAARYCLSAGRLRTRHSLAWPHAGLIRARCSQRNPQ